MEDAVSIIKSGGVVGIPTETVYGLAADATNLAAVRKIYDLKGRPSNNPLIVHVANISKAKELADFDEAALSLANQFWPGPLTMVLKKKNPTPICKEVFAGLDTIALRIPSHTKAISFLEEVGIPLAAPSANISNYISPTSLKHVKEAFGDEVSVIEGGNSVYGIESTIIDLSRKPYKILRPGFITKEALAQVLDKDIEHYIGTDVKAPGMMSKHYAPKIPLRTNAHLLHEGEIGLGFGEHVIGQMNLSVRGDLVEAASNFYSMLRTLDEKASLMGANSIAVAPIPNIGIGIALNDKLSRAAST